MIKGGLTQRYARALYELAAEKQQVKEYQEQLRLLGTVLKDNPDFAGLLCGKLAPASAKKQIIEKTFADFADDVKKFVYVIIDKNREGLLLQIIDGYEDLCDQAEGIQQVLVHTAVPMDEAEVAALAASFEKKLGGKVRVKTAVDKKLIGGIKVQIEDTVYDASILQQLHALQQTLAVE